MEERRSIQDIIPPARSKPIRPQVSSATPPPVPPPTPPQPMNLRPEKSNLATIVFVIAGILVVIGIAVGVVSTVFHRAYIMATPYSYTAKVNETVTTSSDSPLPYKLLSESDTATKNVTASGSSHVENHASGTITVFNAFSTSPQKLITNTRFTTPAGLVYRIHEPITVPGYTIKAGVKVPGSVDATVYADEAGDKYNSDLTQFSIPGLKGSPQYELITGRSKNPITGGFVGEQATVDPGLRQTTVDSLKSTLEQSLRTKIAAEAPSGSLVFPYAISISYAENTDTVSGSNATISVTGTANGPAFDGTAFARELATAGGISYAGPLNLANPAALTVHTTASSQATDTPLSVIISGDATLVSSIDQASLAKDLAGKKKTAIQSVLPQYPGISAIDVKIYPFWLSSLPSSPSKIKVELVDSSAPSKT